MIPFQYVNGLLQKKDNHEFIDGFIKKVSEIIEFP
jgi:hypothetical protein